MKSHRRPRRFKVAAGLGLSLCIAGAVSVSWADAPAPAQPSGAYGSAGDGQALPSAKAVPAQPGTRVGSIAALGFSDSDEQKPVLINLPTALRLANASNPTIALAQARVQEAYARLQEARVMWIPDLTGGPAYIRHDGLLQTSTGNVLNVNKWNFFTGGQVGLAVDTTQAIFGPLVARQLVQAQRASAAAVEYQTQLDVAFAYLDLLRAYGELAINREVLSKTEEMYQQTLTASNAGAARYTSDINRASAAVELRRSQRMQIETQIAAASARLARLLFLDPTVDLRPTDLTVLPIDLIPVGMPVQQMVLLGLNNRPEMAESRFLVGAAGAEYRQARLAPLLPRLDVSYSSGLFGGGLDDSTIRWGGRGDGTAQATWTLHNFGLGDIARVRVQQARVNEASAHVREIQAEIGEQVAASFKGVSFIERQLQVDQEGVRQAEEMWVRLSLLVYNTGIRRGRQIEVLEPLTAIDQLLQARTAYLNDVIGYDRAQFQLYWAMGQPPLCALPQATALPVQTPVRPSEKEMARPRPLSDTQPLPPPRPLPVSPTR